MGIKLFILLMLAFELAHSTGVSMDVIRLLSCLLQPYYSYHNPNRAGAM
jgi:hypothetical protein